VEFADTGTKSSTHRVLVVSGCSDATAADDIGFSLEEATTLLAEIRVIPYERCFDLPTPRVVGDLARKARERVEREISAAIERSISPEIRAHWVEQLFDVRADGMPCIEFLQEPPGALTPSSITRQSEKVRKLLEMKVAEIPDLPGTKSYWQMYAYKMRNQRPSRFAQRKEPRRISSWSVSCATPLPPTPTR
jgi:hypothetical protein